MQDKAPKNEKGQHHGYWIIHRENKSIFYTGYYINGLGFGLYEMNRLENEKIKLYYAR